MIAALLAVLAIVCALLVRERRASWMTRLAQAHPDLDTAASLAVCARRVPMQRCGGRIVWIAVDLDGKPTPGDSPVRGYVQADGPFKEMDPLWWETGNSVEQVLRKLAKRREW